MHAATHHQQTLLLAHMIFRLAQRLYLFTISMQVRTSHAVLPSLL